MQQSPDPAAVRRWIETARAELPGEYIMGSTQSAHYLTMTIDENGSITGFDPQNGAHYSSLEALQARMGSGEFKLMYKLTVATPPAGEAP